MTEREAKTDSKAETRLKRQTRTGYDGRPLTVRDLLDGWACHVTHRHDSYSPSGLSNDQTVYRVDEFLEMATYVQTTSGFVKAEPVLQRLHVAGENCEQLSRLDQLRYRRFRRALYRRLKSKPLRLSAPIGTISGLEVSQAAADQANAGVDEKWRGVRLLG